MAMSLDQQRLTSADPDENRRRQYAELRDAEAYLLNHNARVMVDYTGRGRFVYFEANEMLLAVRKAMDRIQAEMRAADVAVIDATPISDPAVGFAQPQAGGPET